MTCRFCKEWSIRPEEMVRYGIRHYAHKTCAIKHFGIDIINKLHPNQLGLLPWKALEDAGILQPVMAAHDAHVKASSELTKSLRASIGLGIGDEA